MNVSHQIYEYGKRKKITRMIMKTITFGMRRRYGALNPKVVIRSYGYTRIIQYTHSPCP
jgi:hypothetical protein